MGQKIKNHVIYNLLICLCLCSSCGSIADGMEKAIDKAFGSIITASEAMTQVLVESTAFIYDRDSLELDKPFYIHQLIVSFANKAESFELKLDSIEATWAKDSIMNFKKITIIEDCILYDQVVIPYHSFYLENDSLVLNVICEYLPNLHIQTDIDNFKCLKANYVMREQKIILKKNFRECSKED